MSTYSTDAEAVNALHNLFHTCKAEIAKVVTGQEEAVDLVLISILSGGHCLLVGVPGLAKTLLVQTVSRVLDLHYNRVQFTPDLMPSDITGSEILGEDRTFKFIKGPIFANIILADEINRTPPKTQAALLEAMQEKNVTIAGVNHVLPKPFFVLATQNPIEQEGTYPLPEAQLDRFMFNILLEYPSFEQEIQVVRNTTLGKAQDLARVLNAEQILYFQNILKNIPVTDHVLNYAVKLVHKTRPGNPFAPEKTNQYLNWGAGPRASQFLILGAQCHAVSKGKYSPDIEDIQAIALPVLRHRIVRNYKAEADGVTVDRLIQELF